MRERAMGALTQTRVDASDAMTPIRGAGHQSAVTPIRRSLSRPRLVAATGGGAASSSPVSAGASGEGAERVDGDGGAQRVLIVEDDRDFAEALESQLAAHGYVVAIAASSKAALERLDTFAAHVALIDLRLGRESGVDAMVKLRGRSPDLQCVMVTAYATVDAAVDAHRLGAFGFLRKPLEWTSVLTTLERCFEQRRLQSDHLRATEALEATNRRLDRSNAALRRAMEAMTRLAGCATIDALADATASALSDIVGARDHEVSVSQSAPDSARQRGVDAATAVEPRGTVAWRGADLALRIEAVDARSTSVEIALRADAKRPFDELDQQIAQMMVSYCAEVARSLHAKAALDDESSLLRQSQEDLQMAQRLDALGRMAGGVAHDFNNLLTPILTYTEMALMTLGTADVELRADLLEVERAATRASELTRGLLAYSRRQVMVPKRVDVREVVSGMHSMLRRLIPEDVAVELALGDGPLPVMADSAQLAQVILNLALNARDAMPRGGRLTIRAGASDGGDPTTSMDHGAGPRVVLAVEDTGTGIPAAIRPHIFDPFFTTKGSEGNGLGLSIVHGIVLQSGGDLHVRGTTGGGTTFEVWLPRADGPDEEVTASPDGGRASVALEGTILLVEDDDAVRRAARRVLSEAGYEVVVATSGDDALIRVAAHGGTFDLVLTDVVMPGIGAGELVERLHATRPDLPVLFMSGYANDEVVRRGVATEGAMLLPKPFTPDTLLAAVATALGRDAGVGVHAQS